MSSHPSPITEPTKARYTQHEVERQALQILDALIEREQLRATNEIRSPLEVIDDEGA